MSSRPPRAVITGLGAVSGFGDGAERLWQALLRGERAMRPSPALASLGVLAADGTPGVMSWVPGDDPLGRGDRAGGMALAAAAEAVRDAGGVSPGEGLAVTVGTTLGCIGRWLDGVRGAAPWAEVGRWGWSAPGELVARSHGARGPVVATSVACASGNAALGAALDLIRRGRATQVLAGGVDALHDFVMAGFASLKALDPAPCRPFDRSRRGLNLGEGACFVVVEEEGHARARGAVIRAFLDGYGDAADANHMTGPDREGRGAARAVRAALADAGAAEGEIDFVSAHGTATIFNDLMEAKALAAVFPGRYSEIPVNSIKSAIGHTLGAAGLFEALLCVRTLETGQIAPTPGLTELDPEIPLDVVTGAARPARARAVLSTSSGFGGTNAAVVLRHA